MICTRLLAALLAFCCLVSAVHAQSGACCNVNTGACTATGAGAAGCTCGTTYAGDGAVCSPSPCVTGACCNAAAATSGQCSVTGPNGCFQQTPTVYMGNGTTCSPNPCPRTGACCNATTGACSPAFASVNCAAGTTFQGAGSTCFPNPCGGSVCCNTTTGACTALVLPASCAAGTTNMGVGSICSPTPCTTGACCNNATGACTTGGTGCASGLTYQGIGTVCTPTPCPAATNACCNATSGACTASVTGGCVGTVMGTTCTPNPCPQGACCNSTTGACTSTAAAGCTTAPANNFQGAGVACSPNPCPGQICCNLTTGACTFSGTTACAAGTASSGSGTVCSPNPCVIGACCNLTTGACTTPLGTANCTGGVYQGNGVTCTSSPCVIGACCNNTTGACTTPLGTANCTGGTYQGDGVTCASNLCVGACCNNTTGACTTSSTGGCAAGTTWQGMGTSCFGFAWCGGVSGGCCHSDGTCVISESAACLASLGAFLGTATTCPSGVQCFGETEANDNRSQPNGPFLMNSGDFITGVSTGQGTSGGALNTWDYFSVKPNDTAGPGIYKHLLTLTSPGLAQRFQLKGRSQFDSQPSSADAFVTFDMTSGTGAHTVAWYGFGNSEPIILAANGSAVEAYKFTLTTTPVTTSTSSALATPMIDAGSMPGGLITVSSVGETTTDTSFWVYDSTFTVVPGFGNDDVADVVGHGILQSQMSKDLLTPGSYYVGISDYHVGNDQLQPLGDRYPSKSYYDYPGVISQMNVSNSLGGLNMNFKIVDGAGAEHHITATKVNPYDIVWVKFTVTAPTTGSCCKPDGTCSTSSQSACTGLFTGTYGGDNSACGLCPQPPAGACCQNDGTCSLTSVYACLPTFIGDTNAHYPGAWRGAGTTCAAAACAKTLFGNPHLENGAGSVSSGAGGQFVDITAGTQPIQVSGFSYYANQSYNNFNPKPVMDVFVRPGSYLGNEIGTCDTQSPPPNGWVFSSETALSALPVGSSFAEIYVPLASPITIQPGQTIGFYMQSRSCGLKSPTITSLGDATFSNGDLTMFSDRGKSLAFNAAPGWLTALLAASHSFSGRVFYTVVGAGVCCRGSTCNASIAQADCTPIGTAGASYPTSSGAACNAGGSRTTPCCYADYNKTGGITVTDIFNFLTGWFAASPLAIPGGDGISGTPTVANIFQFLSAWFAGGC